MQNLKVLVKSKIFIFLLNCSLDFTVCLHFCSLRSYHILMMHSSYPVHIYTDLTFKKNTPTPIHTHQNTLLKIPSPPLTVLSKLALGAQHQLSSTIIPQSGKNIQDHVGYSGPHIIKEWSPYLMIHASFALTPIFHTYHWEKAEHYLDSLYSFFFTCSKDLHKASICKCP